MRQCANAMDRAPGAASAQGASGAVRGGAAAIRLAAANGATPGLQTPDDHTGWPQGLAFYCRYASLPTVLYYGGYGRKGGLSGKGFHYFESFAGLNDFSRDFLLSRNY